MSTGDITAEVGVEREEKGRPGMLVGAQPGSPADLMRLRGRAENYFNWASIFLGVLLLRWFVWFGDGLNLFESVALLCGGVALWRNRGSLVGAGLVAGGSLVLAIDLIVAAAEFEMDAAIFALLTLVIALGARYGLRIRKLLVGENRPAAKKERLARRADFTLAKPVRQVAGACIVTGCIYLFVTVLLSGMALELGEFLGILQGDMWFLDLPIVGMEIVEDLTLILAGAVFLVAKAAWTRAVLAALCGVYAMEWWLMALSGYGLTLKELCFALFWSFGFTVLASRRRVDEFAEVEDTEIAFTVPEQLDAVIRISDEL